MYIREPGSWGETFAIIMAVFKALALPLGLLFGAIFGLLFIIWAFTISGWLGLGIVGTGVLAWSATASGKQNTPGENRMTVPVPTLPTRSPPSARR